MEVLQRLSMLSSSASHATKSEKGRGRSGGRRGVESCIEALHARVTCSTPRVT